MPRAGTAGSTHSSEAAELERKNAEAAARLQAILALHQRGAKGAARSRSGSPEAAAMEMSG